MKIINYILFCITLFGYSQTDKNISIKNDSIYLEGTLTYTHKTAPLIIWIHGSGTIDRNGNTPVAKIVPDYIKQIKTELVKNDFAFYSFDKRTINPKNKLFLKNILFDDLVNDVKTIISYFKKEYHFSKIILIGHSQGSLIGMLNSKYADGYISLAGPAKAIDKIIMLQLEKQNPLFKPQIATHFEELKNTGTIQQINPLLASIFQKDHLDFLKNWMNYTPEEEIKKITVPTLIINGTRDLQVSLEEAKILKQALPTSKLVILKDMNHVLKTVTNDTDNYKSYYTNKYPISNKLTQTLINFINTL